MIRKKSKVITTIVLSMIVVGGVLFFTQEKNEKPVTTAFDSSIETKESSFSETNLINDFSDTNDSLDTNTQTETKNVREQNLIRPENEIQEINDKSGKQQQLTEKQMLQIGNTLMTRFVTDYASIKDEASLKIYIDSVYRDNKTAFKNYKEFYKEDAGKYSKLEVDLQNEKVAHYNQTAFSYTAEMKEIGFLVAGATEINTTSVKVLIDLDESGEYKIASFTTE